MNVNVWANREFMKLSAVSIRHGLAWERITEAHYSCRLTKWSQIGWRRKVILRDKVNLFSSLSLLSLSLLLSTPSLSQYSLWNLVKLNVSLSVFLPVYTFNYRRCRRRSSPAARYVQRDGGWQGERWWGKLRGMIQSEEGRKNRKDKKNR